MNEIIVVVPAAMHPYRIAILYRDGKFVADAYFHGNATIRGEFAANAGIRIAPETPVDWEGGSPEAELRRQEGEAAQREIKARWEKWDNPDGD